MKKRTLILIAAVLLALVLPTLLVACDKTENVDYSVTVIGPDGSPLSDITVKWLSGSNVAGSAKTDAEGKATASLAKGTYEIALEGYAEGLTYTTASVTDDMPEIELNLSLAKIKYTVTVKNSAGSPAADVTVNFLKGSSMVGSAVTNAQGVAEKELEYGQYSVTLNNLPSGEAYDGAKSVSGNSPSVEFALRQMQGEAKEYSVKVVNQGGLLFKDQTVLVYRKGDPYTIASGATGEDGIFRFEGEAGDYEVEASDLPAGYASNKVDLSATVTEAEILLTSSIIADVPTNNFRYYMGDIFHDYKFTTPYNMADGKPWSKSISQIFAEGKKAILLNNWGTNCTYCVQEMPAMQEAYEKYGDDIEIIAVSNYAPLDTDQVIRNHYAQNGYTFPMMRDTNNFTYKFGIKGWPTTVVIDRYGAIARIESGAISSAEVWGRLIEKYIGDDYVQTFIPGESISESINNEVAKPDITVDEDHYTTQIPAALHKTETFGNASITWRGVPKEDYEYAWPFIIGNDPNVITGGGQYLYASNTGKANSMAAIYATVNTEAGRLLQFDFRAETESNDVLSIVWDGRIIRTISGYTDGWETCYLYADITSGSHSLAIAYIKDNSGNGEGFDNVYIKDIRFSDLSELDELDESIDFLRGAGYGELNEGATEFPYYADVAIDPEDGFFHVNLGSLQNSQFAGSDNSPLLLVNLLNVTPWSPWLSLNNLILGVDPDTGEYITDCTFSVNGVTADYRPELVRYLAAANSSDIHGFVPVNQRLHDLLVTYMAHVSGEDSHENEWLEVCYFYSHYGAGSPKGNPIIGLMPETAIKVTTDTVYTANLTRITYPFPTLIFTFTPEEDGLYKIESFIPDNADQKYAAQIWLYDDNTDGSEPLAYSGEGRLNIDGINEQNFVLYYNMVAGHKYYLELALLMAETGSYDFSITKQKQDVTVLEPTSSDLFDFVIDDKGNITDEIILAGAVDYVKDSDGNYHVKNPDGTMGDFIYLDVDRGNSMALFYTSIRELLDMKVRNPAPTGNDDKYLKYNYFDFTYSVVYFVVPDSDGIITYDGELDISKVDPKYKDYTEIMRGYVNSAPTDGEMKGLIKVNDEIIEIMSLFIELRVNSLNADVENVEINEDGYITSYDVANLKVEAALDNEWLRFCWYFHVYKAETTANE